MQGVGSQPDPQIPLRLLAEMPKPHKVDDMYVAKCNDLLDAIHLCVHLSRLPHYALAERLGIDRGHWTRIMQGQAHFPTRKLGQLMQLCGNYAPMQFMARESGFQLFEDAKAKRKEELRRELAALEAA